MKRTAIFLIFVAAQQAAAEDIDPLTILLETVGEIAPEGPFIVSASDRFVWVADTTTGQVKACGIQKMTDQPVCSPWSAPNQ